MTANKCKWIRLGELIEQCDERNKAGNYSLEDVRGISTNKDFTDTKANLEGVSLASYKVVKPNEFAYVPDTSRRGDRISLGRNNENKSVLVSSISTVFRVCNDDLDSNFLYLYFSCPEFDRYARFHSWGSAREAFTWEDMCRVVIPLPPLSEQRKAVNAWQALRELKEQNEASAAPLMQICQSYLQQLKHQYPAVEIGELIERIAVKNTDNAIKEVRSVSVTKEFNFTNAKVDKNNLRNYKIVKENEFSFVQTTGNEKCLCVALNKLGYPIVVTSVNEVFRADESVIVPDFLHMIFRRKETDRYVRFHSWGSAREIFSWEDMQRFTVPLPPLSVQRAIVSIYACANEAKQLSSEADRLSREACPALIQHVIHHAD